MRVVLFLQREQQFWNLFVDSFEFFEKHIISYQTGIWYKMAGVKQRNMIDTAKPQEKGKRASTMTKVANNNIDSGEMWPFESGQSAFRTGNVWKLKKELEVLESWKFCIGSLWWLSCSNEKECLNSCRLLFSYFSWSELLSAVQCEKIWLIFSVGWNIEKFLLRRKSRIWMTLGIKMCHIRFTKLKLFPDVSTSSDVKGKNEWLFFRSFTIILIKLG